MLSNEPWIESAIDLLSLRWKGTAARIDVCDFPKNGMLAFLVPVCDAGITRRRGGRAENKPPPPEDDAVAVRSARILAAPAVLSLVSRRLLLRLAL